MRLALAALGVVLAMTVDNSWLRDARYEVDRTYQHPVLLVRLPVTAAWPMDVARALAAEAAGCAAIALPGSGLDLPLPVILLQGERRRYWRLVVSCPT